MRLIYTAADTADALSTTPEKLVTLVERDLMPAPFMLDGAPVWRVGTLRSWIKRIEVLPYDLSVVLAALKEGQS